MYRSKGQMRVKHKTQGWFKFFCMINSRSDLLATTNNLRQISL